jgi:hypothetical protein
LPSTFFRENGTIFSPGFMTAKDGTKSRRSKAKAPAVLAEAFMASSLAVSAGYFKTRGDMYRVRVPAFQNR